MKNGPFFVLENFVWKRVTWAVSKPRVGLIGT